MQKSNKTRWNKQIIHDCLLCAGAAFLIVVFFVSGVLNAPKVWPDVQMDHRREDASYSLDQGDQYGVVASGPYYDLDRGTYRLRWQIDGDGSNVIRFGNSTGGTISPSEVRTQPNEWQGEIYFTIEEPVHNFYIEIEFVEGTWMEVYNLRLYTPEYTDKTWIVSAVFLTMLTLYLLHRHGKLRAWHVEAFGIIGLAVLAMSVPALGRDALDSIDMRFHTSRLMNLADGLRNGGFPVRIGGFSYNGYGAVTSVFYPDFLLYPFALMLLQGASLSFVINAIRVAVYVFMAMNMYICAAQLMKNRRAAICASVLYVCAPYFIRCMYVNFMLGQIQAMAVMPFFILGLWEVICGDKQKWYLLVVSATLIYQCHQLTTLLCAVSSVAIGAACMPKILKENRLKSIVLAVAVTVCLNAFTLIPFVTLYLSGVNTRPVGQLRFAETALTLGEALAPNGWLGIALLLGIAASFVSTEETELRNGIKVFGLLGGFFVLLSTSVVPWGHVSLLTGGAVDVIQFPSRCLTLGVPLLCLYSGWGYVNAFEKKGRASVMITLAIAILAVWPTVDRYMASNGYFEFGQTANLLNDYTEYQIEGTDVNMTRSKEVTIIGDIELLDYVKESTSITAEVSSNDGGAIEFPLFAFDGYKAELDGREIAIARGDNNRIHVEIPAGASGSLRIWFAGKMLWRMADAVSLMTAIGLGICWIRQKMRRGRYAEE